MPRGYFALVLHAHRNGWDILTRHPGLGMDFKVYQQFWRLLGVDQFQINGIRVKYWEPDESFIASFKALAAPLELSAGFEGTIVASGYGEAEMNGNQNAGRLDLSTNGGGCAIAFGGAAFGDPGAFPLSFDANTVPHHYAAGTFEYGLQPGAEPPAASGGSAASRTDRMLRTRLWMGAVLIAMTVGVLLLDNHLAPYHPFLFLFVLGLALLGTFELLALLGPARRPWPALCYVSVAALVVANWPVHLWSWAREISPSPLQWVLGTYTAVVLVGFLGGAGVGAVGIWRLISRFLETIDNQR